MQPYDIGAALVNAFLYLILLSTFASAVADVIGQMLGVIGKAKRILSTIFCLLIVIGWQIGLFRILFGEPIGESWVKNTFQFIDVLGTALVAGAGSGFVADVFRTIVARFKEWKQISTLNKIQTKKKIIRESGPKTD